jgi:hypothetical protein
MTARFAFEPTAREIYLALRKDPGSPLYLAIRELLNELLEDPGNRRLRRLLYRPDIWGVPVPCGGMRWLVLWRPSAADSDVVEVHYIGPMPANPPTHQSNSR